jgi:hypothetical protein
MEALIREHHYPRNGFFRADGEETVYAPHGMEKRFVRNDFLEPGPLKGTWLYFSKDYYGEGDCDLPISVLREIETWSSFSEDDMQRFANGCDCPAALALAKEIRDDR